MIKVLLGLVLAMFALSVESLAQTVTPDKYFRSTPTNGLNLSNKDGDTVCKHAITQYRAFNNLTSAWTYVGPTVSFASSSSGGCYYKVPPSTGLVNNGTWTKLSCTTALPFFDDGQQKCVAAPPPPSCAKDSPGTYTWARGPNRGDGLVDGGYSPLKGLPTDGNNCAVEITEVVGCYQNPDSVTIYCTYKGKTTGAPQPAGPESPAPGGPPKVSETQSKDFPPTDAPPNGRCPLGSVQAGVSADGVAICMGTGTAPKNPPPPPPKIETSKTEATEDGGSKKTDTAVTTNSDGSKTTTTTTTTTGADGSKTTVVNKDTTPAPSGSPGKDESTKDDEKYDLCKQNPMLTMCRNSTVAGACGETTCTGDAIQCATLRAAAAMECRDKKNQEDLAASPLVTSGERILSGADTTAADFSKGSVVDMSKQNLDQSGFVAGSCLANRSFTVSGHTVQMSFAQVCDKIQPLRAVVMACAFIISYLIVSRSVIQG